MSASSPAAPQCPSAARVGAAVVAARIAGAASRALRRGGGTALPGLVAERVAPAALLHLASQIPGGAVVVTGTNGKTTTSHMLASILRAAGRPVLRNASGSNLARGLLTTLAARADWRGRLRVAPGTVAVFETDEAAVAQVVPLVQPRLVVVTNLFRDQLDRYGEVDTVAAIWRAALDKRRAAPGGWPPALVLNADDPTVAALGLLSGGWTAEPTDEGRKACPERSEGTKDESPSSFVCRPSSHRERAFARAHGTGLPPLYFGVEDTRWGTPGPEHASDAKICPVCGVRLEYPVCFYGHVGHYACANGHRRPPPAVAALDLELQGFAGTNLTLQTPRGRVSVRLPVPGLYNVHNALAAAGAACVLGVPLDAIRNGLAGFSAAFGRLERAELGGRTLYLVLAKNPVGMNEALRTLLAGGAPKHLLMALNDLDADGRDVSWIWDADFERVTGKAASLVVTGRRAEDLAVRLKYAGALDRPGSPGSLDSDGVTIEPAIALALDAALRQTPPGETLYAVVTYTAMLELRRVLVARGALRAYWEDEP